MQRLCIFIHVSILILVFSPYTIRSYLCPKKARYERFLIYSTNIRCHHPWRQRLRSLHIQDIRSLQGGAQYRTYHHQRQNEVHPEYCELNAQRNIYQL